MNGGASPSARSVVSVCDSNRNMEDKDEGKGNGNTFLEDFRVYVKDRQTIQK